MSSAKLNLARVQAKGVATAALLARLAATTLGLENKTSARGGSVTEGELNEVLDSLASIGRDAERIRRG